MMILYSLIGLASFIFVAFYIYSNSMIATTLWSSYQAVTPLNLGGYNITNVSNINATEKICDGSGCIGDIEEFGADKCTINIQPSFYKSVKFNISDYSEKNYAFDCVPGTHYEMGEYINEQ